MSIPLLALNPTTCLMLADFHKEHPPTRVYWLRIAIILNTAVAYNDGQLSETMMKADFTTALEGSKEAVIDLTSDWIRGIK